MNERPSLWLLGLVVATALITLSVRPAATVTSPVINEFVFNHVGTDVFEFVEVYGDPDTDYSGLTILEIEGDNTVAGIIDGIFPIGVTDAGGFWTTGFMSDIIENGTVTLLLVDNFTGSLGDDLDLDNDGTLDILPFDWILDEVAVTDGGANDRTYASVTLAEDFDGIPYTPGGASRIPNGMDTDTVNDWVRNDYDGEGLPGLFGTPSLGEALNTPGDVNQPVTPTPDPVINEFVANHTGGDVFEFVEIFGEPNTNYLRFSILEIEGDGTNIGRVDKEFPVGMTDADGFWTTGFLSGDLENGTMTLLLVENFTGYIGQDLDLDNDGILDITPFGRIVDAVAVLNGDPNDQVYSATVLTADFDGNPFLPGGASRIPNGVDTDALADWLRNDYDGEGLPGLTGSPIWGEALNTPGMINEPVADTTPPVITVDLNRTILWPPNHKMAEICATVTVTDNADPTPQFVLTSVTSSEPDNGRGDGNTTGDIQDAIIGTDDVCFLLRAERMGGGNGREYTIVYTATDSSGNSATMTVAVRVPHDHSGWAMASEGFISDGTGLDESSEEFAVIIPSKLGVFAGDGRRNLVVVEDGYDATEIDTHHLYVGNANGALRPIRSMTLDANGDGLQDLAVFYSVSGALALQNTPPENGLHRRSGGAIGVHYGSRDGTDYLVANVFDLGNPVPLIEADPSVEFGDAQEISGQNRAATTPAVFPNPFNPTATISFELATRENVSVRIYDVRGSLVRVLENRVLEPGQHTIPWDGKDGHGTMVTSGVYLVRINSRSLQVTHKAVMLK